MTDSVIAEIAPSSESTTDPMVEADLAAFLVDRLGINPDQAKEGMGFIFAFAQQRTMPEDFAKLSGSLPDMDQYLAAVPRSSFAFRFNNENIAVDEERPGPDDLALLAASFQTLGMNPEMVFQFEETILQYLRLRGELAAMSVLQNALYVDRYPAHSDRN
ncbi:DUF2780 domain-containing protein [Methylomonas sp. MgM2]